MKCRNPVKITRLKVGFNPAVLYRKSVVDYLSVVYLMTFYQLVRKWYSSVGLVAYYRLDDRATGVQIPGKGKGFVI
jgi:hypothetical protein